LQVAGDMLFEDQNFDMSQIVSYFRLKVCVNKYINVGCK